jgi:hypothetical protein
MIEKIYDRKKKFTDILISGQHPRLINNDDCMCKGGAPVIHCLCMLEILRNETGEGFPDDVVLEIKIQQFYDHHFIENILIFRSPRSKYITINYSLCRKPLDLYENIIKAHFKTCKDDVRTLKSKIKLEVNIYDKILKDIGLLSLYTREFREDELEEE